MAIKKVLCVCFGNSDRSPAMAAVLGMFLQGKGVVCESAGVSEFATKGGNASSFAVTATKRIGLDISGHTRRQTASLNLGEYDLFVCADDSVAAQVIEHGADMEKVVNVQVPNPWPVKFQGQYDKTFALILSRMYEVVEMFFS